MNNGTANTRQRTGLSLVKKGVQRVEALQVVREATTGRVVVYSHTGNLPRVWAVAEVQETMTPGTPVLVTSPVLLPEEASDLSAQPLSSVTPEVAQEPVPVEVRFYRKYTEAMLRRYLQMSTEVGRVPSLLGRELFRGNVTHCKVSSFEGVVIFCHDMEKILMKLRPIDRQLLLRITMQEYSQEEAASMLGLSFRTCKRGYAGALDRLTAMLLETRLLEPLENLSRGQRTRDWGKNLKIREIETQK